jgi:hypothetical protein
VPRNGRPAPLTPFSGAGDVDVVDLRVDRLARPNIALSVDARIGHGHHGRVGSSRLAATAAAGNVPPVKALKTVVLPLLYR